MNKGGEGEIEVLATLRSATELPLGELLYMTSTRFVDFFTPSSSPWQPILQSLSAKLDDFLYLSQFLRGLIRNLPT